MADPSIMFAQPNAGAAFAQAFQQGMENNREKAVRSAMAALVQDPNNAQALGALAKLDPATAMQFRQQQAQMLKEQLAQHQDSIIKGAEIIREFQPKDQQSYSQALSAAQAAGIDISQVPQQYNPQYVDGIVHLADAMKPQPSDVQVVPITAGGGAVQFNKKTGQIAPLVVPNSGSAAPSTPTAAAPTAVNPKTGERVQYNAQTGQWEPMTGGATGSAPSPTFSQ
jgi:hypothetical protein